MIEVRFFEVIRIQTLRVVLLIVQRKSQMQFRLDNYGQIFNKIESNEQKRAKNNELRMSFYTYARNHIRNVFVGFKPVRPPYNAYERIKRTDSDRFKRRADKHKANKNAAHPHLLGSKNFKYFQKRFHVSTENVI